MFLYLRHFSKKHGLHTALGYFTHPPTGLTRLFVCQCSPMTVSSFPLQTLIMLLVWSNGSGVPQLCPCMFSKHHNKFVCNECQLPKVTCSEITQQGSIYDIGWHYCPVQLHTEFTDHNRQRWIGTSDLNSYSLSHSALMLGNSDSMNHKSSTISQDTYVLQTFFLICIQLFCRFLWMSVKNNHIWFCTTHINALPHASYMFLTENINS